MAAASSSVIIKFLFAEIAIFKAFTYSSLVLRIFPIVSWIPDNGDDSIFLTLFGKSPPSSISLLDYLFYVLK